MQLGLTRHPGGNPTCGDPMFVQPAVYVLDRGGNPALVSGTVYVTASVVGGGPVSGTSTIEFASGGDTDVAFENLGVGVLGDAVVVRFSAPGLLHVDADPLRVRSDRLGSWLCLSTHDIPSPSKDW